MKFNLRSAAALALASTLTACGAPPPDLTVGKPFDAKADREKVLYCVAVQNAFSDIAYGILKMKPAKVGGASAEASARATRTMHFFTFLRIREKSIRDFRLFEEAEQKGQAYVRGYRARALIPSNRDRLYAEIVAASDNCDKLIRSWGLPQPNDPPPA